MKKSPLIFMAVWLVCGLANALAALTVSLDAPVVNAAAGNEIVFSGTLTNTDATAKIFLNDIQCSMPAGLTLRQIVFFANVPGILLPGESYTGPVFSVALAANASPGDYICTLALKGGADIFATDSLTTAGFTVLSPLVGITATTANASELGPVSGAFTVTRSGGTDIPLSVSFSIGGSAVNGSTCTTIGTSLVIPSGAASANVAVVPIPNNVAEGNRTVLLTLAVTGTFNISTSATATVTIRDKPADQWRVQNFSAQANSPAASDLGDWEGDGIHNLVEYGLNLDPKLSDRTALPQYTIVNGYLTISFVPNPVAVDLIYSVESSTDLTAWSTNDVESVVLANPVPPNRQTFRYSRPVTTVPCAYLRVKIQRLP